MVYHSIAAFYTTKLIFDEKKIGLKYRRRAEDIMYGESVSIKVMKMEFCFIAPEENLFCCSIIFSLEPLCYLQKWVIRRARNNTMGIFVVLFYFRF